MAAIEAVAIETATPEQDVLLSRPLRRQIAAVPIREEPGWRPQMLLVTSRETGRWVIPKGWPMQGMDDARAAALEAREEAGVIGRLRRDVPVGAYSYQKRLANGDSVTCRVAVYVLDVEKQLKSWKEKNQRTLRWFDPEEAAEQVAEPELAALLRRIGRGELG